MSSEQYLPALERQKQHQYNVNFGPSVAIRVLPAHYPFDFKLRVLLSDRFSAQYGCWVQILFVIGG